MKHECSVLEPHQKLWGCFGHEGTRPWEMPCPSCIGFVDPNCPNCGGNQWIESHICINSVIGDGSHELDAWFDTYHIFRTHNILPESGGWNDQPQTFKQIYDIAGHVERMIEKRKETRSDKLKSLKGG